MIIKLSEHWNTANETERYKIFYTVIDSSENIAQELENITLAVGLRKYYDNLLYKSTQELPVLANIPPSKDKYMPKYNTETSEIFGGIRSLLKLLSHFYPVKKTNAMHKKCITLKVVRNA